MLSVRDPKALVVLPEPEHAPLAILLDRDRPAAGGSEEGPLSET